MPSQSPDQTPEDRAVAPTSRTQDASPPRRVTTRALQRMCRSGQPITMLTAYDYPTAAVLDAAGIDILLVGDSLAMVVQGHETTLGVTLDQMIYHAEMVGRAAQRALVVVDLPFPEAQMSIDRSLVAAARVIKETRCQAVKIEGGREQAERVAALITAGIPVMGHIGLRPQNMHIDGGYLVRRDPQPMIDDGLSLQAAGAFAIVIEGATSDAAAAVTDALDVPTIGIGAGPATSGQVLVLHDLVGLTCGHVPRFVTQMADVRGQIEAAAQAYRNAVRNHTYPGPEHEYR